MKIACVLPCVGRKTGESYPKSWQMEPLAFAQLAALTPSEDTICFYDDRMEAIDYDTPVDLVAINAETYTARRAYQIASRFKEKGVPTVLGGFHPTLVPTEAGEHADSIMIGPAERDWPTLLEDAKKGTLKPVYGPNSQPMCQGIHPDRTIFQGKNYGMLTLIETARGCRFNCEFCSISSFFEKHYHTRPVEEVVEEIRQTNARNVFFIDDNICVEPGRARELFEALIPLKIRWTGQVSINIAEDEGMLSLMRRSGCVGALIGFESLNPEVLAAMDKKVNANARHYTECLTRFRRHQLGIYGTFVFGYDQDTEESFRQTLEFSMEHKLFFAAFNHLVPFPGTPLYTRLKNEGRLLYDNWWLDPDYRFGQVAFRPARMSPKELEECCLKYRHRFYSTSSIFRRGMDFRANCRNPFMAALFYYQNFLSGREVHRRQGLPMGVSTEGSL